MKALHWLWLHVLPLCVLGGFVAGIVFGIGHISQPAHPVQGERQIRNSERLTRLETIIGEGPRWTEEEMEAFAKLNGLKMPE